MTNEGQGIGDYTPLLKVKNLKIKKGEITILDIPSFSVREGEILSLIGPNGAGKTTLLQTLAYLTKPVEGEIFCKGKKIGADLSGLAYRRRIAMVFQEPLLFDTTVFNNVASGLRIRGIKKREIRERVLENLERFGISHLRDRSARTLSGGEAQRTSLARAFALQPDLLLLDEPFTSLDPPTRDSLIEDLDHILQKTKTAVVLATHDRWEALRLADRLAIMKDGQILQIGSAEEVMNKPVNEFVASFLGVESILAGRVLRKEKGSILVSVSGQEMEAIGEYEPGEAVALCIRPENVTLTTFLPQQASSARNVFAGKIIKITPLGLFNRVQLDCGFPLISYITNHSLENLSLQEGKEIFASFKATSIHVVKKKNF